MNDKKQIFGWCMYDWANSAFILTVITAVMPIYFSDVIVPKEGYEILGTLYSATALWGFLLGLSSLLVFVFAPALGAMADHSGSRKKFLMVFCYVGVLATLALYACREGDVWLTMACVMLAQIGFAGGNSFYDAILPHLVSEEKRDWVSGKGFAYGYLGGDLHFLIALSLILFHDNIGLTSGEAARIALASAGLWWGGFAIFTWKGVRKETSSANQESSLEIMRRGFTSFFRTTRKIASDKSFLIFLIAFMMYNEGVQTTIMMATIYGKEELHLGTPTLMGTLVVIQILALFGSLLFSRLAEKIGTKNAILTSLMGWSFAVIYAYFITSEFQYMLLGAFVGIILAPTQSLSRSLYSRMIPSENSAEYFGFYSVFTKFSAIWGPLVFGVIRQITGTARLSIVSLIVFFITGMILLHFVKEKKVV